MPKYRFSPGEKFLNNRVVAFDFGGTLAAQPALQQLAVALVRAGFEVHIISAVPNEPLYARESTLSEIRKLCEELEIQLAGVHIVLHPRGDNGSQVAGREKVRVMQEIGANWLIDDNVVVAGVVREAGLEVVRVDGTPNFWERPRNRDNYDEQAYLARYPDVALAVKQGQYPDGYTHYKLHGAKEGRCPN